MAEHFIMGVKEGKELQHLKTCFTLLCFPHKNRFQKILSKHIQKILEFGLDPLEKPEEKVRFNPEEHEVSIALYV